MCIGKALTGGSITMAACVASEKVADTITNSKIPAFMHGPTYMANPLACAAGIASLSLFESRVQLAFWNSRQSQVQTIF